MRRIRQINRLKIYRKDFIVGRFQPNVESFAVSQHFADIFGQRIPVAFVDVRKKIVTDSLTAHTNFQNFLCRFVQINNLVIADDNDNSGRTLQNTVYHIAEINVDILPEGYPPGFFRHIGSLLQNLAVSGLSAGIFQRIQIDIVTRSIV